MISWACFLTSDICKKKQNVLSNKLLKDVEIVLISRSFEYHEFKSKSITEEGKESIIGPFFSFSFLNIEKITNLTSQKHLA